jgi:ornithine cyclodeaminase/alanine dehydrogenase-like protein (mu-crystallin family)
MQLDSTRNKAFEVLGTTLMKRMLRKKGLLDDSFIIPVDLHQELFRDMDADSFERADDLLVDFHTEKREIVFTVIEIKCRQNLSDDELAALQEKMQHQNDLDEIKRNREKVIASKKGFFRRWGARLFGK